MGQPQMPRDDKGRFTNATGTKGLRVPRAQEKSTQRFSRLHSAIRARNIRETAMTLPLPTGRTPVFDDIYDLYVHYEK